ncbi:MAG TPA: acetyl-CoA carboxylase biotin carboxyl carrier protein subunit, partial [Leptospiraceae bacterium]|nr:acetyl-CoA carboxylase biotin carboxyl carrier protein subunit [Leptospiraceae bacterium]
KAPCDEIWDHDEEILETGLAFYRDLQKISGKNEPYSFFDDALRNNKNPAPDKIPADVWEKCMGSHAAFQVGLDLIKIIPKVGRASGFFEIRMNESTLEAEIPEKFTNAESVTKLVKFLAPPPKAKSDEIIAPMGGMFYAREAPNMPPMIKVGDHFNAGQPLFIIEVMKMFNKIVAPFSGTITKSFMEDADGKIIQKGQPIFKVQPDEVIVEETEEQIYNRKKKATLELMA